MEGPGGLTDGALSTQELLCPPPSFNTNCSSPGPPFREPPPTVPLGVQFGQSWLPVTSISNQVFPERW